MRAGPEPERTRANLWKYLPGPTMSWFYPDYSYSWIKVRDVNLAQDQSPTTFSMVTKMYMHFDKFHYWICRRNESERGAKGGSLTPLILQILVLWYFKYKMSGIIFCLHLLNTQQFIICKAEL